MKAIFFYNLTTKHEKFHFCKPLKNSFEIQGSLENHNPSQTFTLNVTKEFDILEMAQCARTARSLLYDMGIGIWQMENNQK